MKYFVNEHKAQVMRHVVGSYLKLDEYGKTQPQLSYPVHSIYLDSPSYKTYQDTINGSRNRYKIRVRFYEDSSRDSVFLEVKRRHDRVIAKKRAEVYKEGLEDLIFGHIPSKDHLVRKTDEQYAALEHICWLITELNAKPKVHVAYLREAYEMEGSNAVRITFDRNVRTQYVNSLNLTPILSHPTTVFGNQVILEFKFTNRFPYWMNELVQMYDLRRDSAAKYVDGINLLKRSKQTA